MKAPPSNSPFWKLMNVMSRVNVAAYRASGGRLGNHIGKAPVLLVHHVGRRTGKARVSPVLYLEDGDRLVIVASKGGTDKNPAWYHNLMAHPDATIEVGRDTIDVVASEAAGEERERLYGAQAERIPQFAEYQKRTQRLIPVIVLTPREGSHQS